MAAGRPSPELGSELEQRIKSFAEAWVKQSRNASKEAANRMAAHLGFSILTTHARQKIRELAERCDPRDPAAGEAALEPWLGVIDAVGESEQLLSRNVNLSLVCDHLMICAGRRLLAAAH